MKKILTFLIASFTCCYSFAQIEVQKVIKKENPPIGEVKNYGTFVCKLIYEANNNDTTYYFVYRNAKYKNIIDLKHVAFNGQKNTLNDFYKILKSVFFDENRKNKEYKVQFKLGVMDVIVSTMRLMGVTSAMFYTDEGFCYLTEHQVDKLFGKG